MALKDFLQQKKTGAAPAAAVSTASESNEQSPAEGPTLAEWLADNQAKTTAADASAPVRSETTVEYARETVFEDFPLDDAGSIGILEVLFLFAKTDSQAASLGFGNCQSCGQRNVFVGKSSLDSHACPTCHHPVVCRVLVYSQEVGAALRERILPAHARCIAALKSAAFDRPKLEQALALANELGHAAATREIERRRLSVELAEMMFLGEMAIVTVTKSPDGGLVGKDSQTVTPEQSAQACGALLAAISSLGHKCIDAAQPAVATLAFETVINMRKKLLGKFPKSLDLRQAQAFDLDELGMVLRDHQPGRRVEALGLVREAAEVLASLDREDPTGREKRKWARDAIAAHLRLTW